MITYQQDILKRGWVHNLYNFLATKHIKLHFISKVKKFAPIKPFVSAILG